MGLITISRGTFGGGKAVAELLAKRLGYVNLSREVVSGEVAERYEIPDEQMLHSISELPGNFGLGESEHRRNMAYFRMIILERAVKSPTVYHSHGGHLILSGISGFMRVRINAGIECRIKYAIQERNIDYKNASALITAIDQKRKQWSQEVWGVEWNEPSLYDLVVNLDQLTLQRHIFNTTINAHFPFPMRKVRSVIPNLNPAYKVNNHIDIKHTHRQNDLEQNPQLRWCNDWYFFFPI